MVVEIDLICKSIMLNGPDTEEKYTKKFLYCCKKSKAINTDISIIPLDDDSHF